MNIQQIYQKYHIPENLQEHHFRVAGVASLIADNFNLELNKEAIVTVCLLHDMGNLIKFNFDLYPEFWQKEGVLYWKNIQNEMIRKYGDDEDIATIKIAEEIGVSQDVLDILKNLGFSKSEFVRDGDDFNLKICHYADGRVSPHGVVSLQERHFDGRERYLRKKNFVEIKNDRFDEFFQAAKEIEKQIFEHCNIKPEDVKDESVSLNFDYIQLN